MSHALVEAAANVGCITRLHCEDLAAVIGIFRKERELRVMRAIQSAILLLVVPSRRGGTLYS